MSSEDVNIDRELIKAQASGTWEKSDYRTLRYVGYAAVEATVEASVSNGRFVWSWSVSTKDKAMPFAGNALTLDKAIKDAQWHIEQVASVEQQVDVLTNLPSNLQTTTKAPPPKPLPPKLDPVRPRKPIWSNIHVKAFAPAVVAGVLWGFAVGLSGQTNVVLGILVYLIFWSLYHLPMTVYVYKTKKFSWPFFAANFFSNWTVIGWIVCIVYATSRNPTIKSSPTPKPQPRRLQDVTQQKTGHEQVPNVNINVSVDVDRQAKDR